MGSSTEYQRIALCLVAVSLKRSFSWRRPGAILAAVALLGTAAASSCGKSKKPIIVGSKDTTAQAILAEIVAQHLEHRLGRKVVRRLSLGSSPIVYQSFANGEIGLYPEETGTMLAVILKDSASFDASTTLERVRTEMLRVAQAEVLDPLGIDNGWAVVVPKSAAQNIETLSAAQSAKTGWKIGVTRDFSGRSDGFAAFNQYRMPMSAPLRIADPASLYGSLATGDLTMVVGSQTDGWLARHNEWKMLQDDKKAFGYYQTCLLVRSDLVLSDPAIKPALAELSGTMSKEIMQNLDAKVAIDHKTPADVAKEFLASTNLK